MPWLEYQFLKQDTFAGAELIVVDSSAIPWESAFATVIHVPRWPRISAKRNAALEFAHGEYVTWFDDDDWQSPFKLSCIDDLEASNYGAAGSRMASMYSTLTGKCSNYESRYEPLIFNSAVYLKSAVPPTFNEALVTGEDTDWQLRFFETRPNFVTLGEPQHAWLCHTKNITNKSSSKFFTQPCTIPFDEWERDFLKRLIT